MFAVVILPVSLYGCEWKNKYWEKNCWDEYLCLEKRKWQKDGENYTVWY